MGIEQYNRKPEPYGSADKQEAKKTRDGSELYDEEWNAEDAGQGGFWEARNERTRSPEFQEAMDREKMEFREQLGGAKDASVNFLYNGILKKVLWGTVKEEAKSAFSGKYNMADSFVHTTGRIADASLMGLKAIGKIAKVTGKGAKIGARYLFGK